MTRFCFCIASFTFLVGCGLGDPTFVRLGDYENDAGAAVVRHLIQHLPELDPGVPKDYCIVKALDLRSTSMDFADRFHDLKLNFVSRDVLIEQEETHFPINPKSGLTPILLHLARMKKLSPEAYEVEGAWAYKRQVGRKRFKVEHTDGQWQATVLEELR